MILRNITIGLAIASVIWAIYQENFWRKAKREDKAQAERHAAGKKIDEKLLRRLKKQGRA
jgi:protein involved in sex pheromone biosynthesis